MLIVQNKPRAKLFTYKTLYRYGDWYKPRPKWFQTSIPRDGLLTEIVDYDMPQPTTDSASLCTGFLPYSSSHSMNWLKIPCDYPLFTAGVICKQEVYRNEEVNGNKKNQD